MKSEKQISHVAVYAWCLFSAFIFLYVFPVFMNAQREMSFPHFIITMSPIGYDYALVRDLLSKWINGDNLAGCPALTYPPISRLVYLPMLLVPLQTGYIFSVCLTLVCFTGVIVWTSGYRGGTRRDILPMVLIPGLMSYGLQFEMERGQFNVVAVCLTVMALALYHAQEGKKAVLVAYFLFTCAIQMKMFPACFVFLFTKDGRDYRGNIVRYCGLGVGNVALLFVLGINSFREFLAGIRLQQEQYFGRVGVSIQSFATLIQKMVDGSISTASLNGINLGRLNFARAWIPHEMQSYIGHIVLIAGMTITVGCFIIMLLVAWRRNSRSAWAYLMMACALFGLLALGNSNAYRLVVLPMTLALFLKESVNFQTGTWKDLMRLSLGILFYFGYCVCLFPNAYLPLFMQSHVPVLLLMLIAMTGLAASDNSNVLPGVNESWKGRWSAPTQL